MHALQFKYCPLCKGELEKKTEYFKCKSCGKVIHINPAPGASVYLVRNRQVLLSKRAKDPFKGEWDSVGGFMKTGETAEEAIVRETKEETGLNLTNLEYLGTYPSEYGEKGAEPIINIYFVGKLSSGRPKPSDDISEVKWFPIGEVNKIKSSFKNVTDSLKDLQKWYNSRSGV